MFSTKEKSYIAASIQVLLRSTGNPELPKGEIKFQIHVWGSDAMSWADIVNNGSVSGLEPDGANHS